MGDSTWTAAAFRRSAAPGIFRMYAKRNRFSFGGQGFTRTGISIRRLARFYESGQRKWISASYERDFSERDRLRLSVSRNEVRFLVPNELLQQNALQRQDITNTETAGQIYFQHTISPELVFSVSGGVRDSNATLSSNPLATR